MERILGLCNGCFGQNNQVVVDAEAEDVEEQIPSTQQQDANGDASNMPDHESNKQEQQSKLPSSNYKKKKVSFVVTGFGPFKRSRNNPTTVLANKIQAHVENSKSTIRIMKTQVLEASIQAALESCSEWKETLEEETNNDDDIHVLVHMGVKVSAKTIHLEQYAYNVADFRISDERGEQPRNQIILNDDSPKVLQTKLPLEKLQHQQQDVVISKDPGRFVCNYLYYCSMAKLNHLDGVHVLFYHVPPFKRIPEPQQLQILTAVLESIEKQLISS